MANSRSAKDPLQPSSPLTFRARLNRFLRRGLLLMAAVLVFYTCFLLLGFVPVNRDYAPPPDDDCVRIFIRSNEIHTDFVLPIVDKASGVDWRELFPRKHFRGDIKGYKYVALGWGDRGFYIDTPRWEDFRLSTALRALFPDEAVLHAEYLYDVRASGYFREVLLSHNQYDELVAFVRISIGRIDDEGHAIEATTKSYHRCDHFYVSNGSYHAFNTCNQWTGRGLAKAGVPTGIWTPLRSQVTWWLKEGHTRTASPNYPSRSELLKE